MQLENKLNRCDPRLCFSSFFDKKSDVEVLEWTDVSLFLAWPERNVYLHCPVVGDAGGCISHILSAAHEWFVIDTLPFVEALK